MTNEIDKLLEKIQDNPIFEDENFFFVGGTALSYYLKHRISYDIDIASRKELPVAKIKSFVFSIGGRAIVDKNASQFKINTGLNIENYHMKFMVNGVKLEFTYFKHEIQMSILENAKYELIKGDATLKILSVKDIALLKVFALFNREKTRDLFDASIIFKQDIISLNEMQNLYSFLHSDGRTIREYIEMFSSSDDDGDNSLDFIRGQEHYKTFLKKEQKMRFTLAKEMFITEFDKKQKELLISKSKEALKSKRKVGKTY